MEALPSPQEPLPPEAISRARCRHFGVCGGCAWQDVEYGAQLARKEEALREVLGPSFARFLKPIVPSPSVWFYRNKMEFAFGFEKDAPEAVALGLRRRGKFWGVTSLEECFLMSEKVAPILASARSWAAGHRLPPYHLRRHTGLLRYLVIREGKRTGQRIVILVTAPPPDEGAFEGTLAGLGESLRPHGVTTFLWSVTDRQADLAVGEVRKAVYGEPWFEEKLAGVSFRLSPYAFFQPNVEGMEVLIERARTMLGAGWGLVVDLYSGVGGLTLPLAGQAGRMTGIELDEAAVGDARRNAVLNGISNTQFVAEDSLTFLRRFSDYSFLADKWGVVLDPPRAGMHPRMAGQLLRVASPVLIYVSCNPRKLAEDLAVLTRAYSIEEAIPYDFFPHTPHVEVLVRLTRR